MKLPDLSTWHPVPVGATIPAGTIAATVYPDEAIIIGVAAHDTKALVEERFFTAERIAVPLPTEDGASIIAYVDGGLRPALLTRRGDIWATHGGELFTNEGIDRWVPTTEWHQR